MTQLSREADACLQACFDSIKACGECLEFCIEAGDEQYADCISVCNDCLMSCSTCISAIARRSDRLAAFCTMCAEICEACATVCDGFKDPMMKRCADACRKSANECRRLAAAPRPGASPAGVSAH